MTNIEIRIVDEELKIKINGEGTEEENDTAMKMVEVFSKYVNMPLGPEEVTYE